MITKRLGIVTALFVLAMAAACSGGGNNPTPVYPNPGQNVTGQVITLTPTSGFSGNFTVAGTPSGAATLTATLSTTAPSGIAALSKDLRTAQAAVAPVPQAYITLTAGTGGAVITSVTTITFTLPAAVPAGESLYLAYYNGTIWKTLGSAGTLATGTTATYNLGGGAISPNITLAAGGQLYLGLYEGTYAVPTPSPSPTPSATPTPFPNAVTNGNFETGSLAPWVACSYLHQPYAAPVNPSPAPAATASQPPDSVGSPSPIIAGSDLTPFVSVTAPPPQNWNPNYSSNTPGNLGSYAALTGSLNAQINGATGICQVVTIPTSGSLTFQVYEGGTAYNFYNGDQEAQILDSTGTTVLQPLFVELNCYYDSLNFPASPAYAASGCFPTVYGGTSAYVDWQGGFWTTRGPYDLSSLAGQTVTLFLGVWTDQSHAGPTSYANYMFVDNVALTGTGIATPPPATPTPSPSPSPAPTATVPVTIQGAQR